MFEILFKYPLKEFAEGSLRLASRLRPELAVLGVLVAVVAATYFYRHAPADMSRRMRLFLSTLRSVVLGLLVIILFEPVLRTPSAIKRDSYLALLIDDSRSMRIDDAGDDGARADKAKRKSRLAVVKDILGEAADKESGKKAKEGLVETLAEICPLRLFKFDARTDRIESVKDVKAMGERSNLYSALKTVDSELRGVSVVGVVLLTDGAANAGGAPQEMAQVMRLKERPIFCVGVGDPKPPRDYEVARVQAPREARSNTALEIFANVRATGFQDPFQVVLRQGNDVLDRIEVSPERNMDLYRVRLAFRPEKEGTFTYTVEVPANKEEVILDNNRLDFIVRVMDKRLPVLYLEGSPREEYRFLRRALYRDKDFRIVSILRLDGPKKFILQGQEPEDGLEEGYPKTAEHLFRFEAVILGDIEASYLTEKQMQITEEFVNKRGGGVLILGGVNSFNLGKYHKTPIAKMMPVMLPDASAQYQEFEFNIKLTENGEKHPIMRQTDNTVLNRDIWLKSPTLIGFNAIREVKPGAEVLAIEPKTGTPIIAVQNYGAGRVAAFTSGGSWHWRMAVPVENELHEKFWKQMVRWLAVGSKAKLSIELDKDLYSLKETVGIRSVLLDKAFQPVNDATVVAKVEDPYGNKQELVQEWILNEDGVYQTQFEPADAGDYKIEVTATLPDKTTATATTTFSVGETLDEFNDAAQKVGLLEEIASASGGKYLAAKDAKKLPELIRERVLKMKREETVYEQRDIWDAPLWFGLIAACLSVEWVVRRRMRLI